jgi:hypothetical protein
MYQVLAIAFLGLPVEVRLVQQEVVKRHYSEHSAFLVQPVP